MRVLYDHQCFTGTAYGGVSRYFYDLLRVFTGRSDIKPELSLLLSNNEYLKEQSFGRYWTYSSLARNRRANQAASLLNRQYSLQRIRAGQFDLFHPTYYHRYFLPAIGSKPVVLTFYDATSERYRQEYPELGAGLFETKQLLINRADAVIAISEFTKQELLRFFDIRPDKIHVVPLSTSFVALPLPTTAPKPNHPYLLYVGKRGFYKNFITFFESLIPIWQQHPDLHLICAGGGSFTPDEQAAIANAGVSERVHYADIRDNKHLFTLYSQAEEFVFPSLNEGFGIPVLEAFAAGCPAILSDCSSLPEVAADAALYFSPQQKESITAAIEQVLTDTSLRKQLIEKGRRRLNDFSAEKTAAQTLQVYQTLV